MALSTTMAIVYSALAVTAASVGTQVYASHQAEERQESLLQYQEEQVVKAETKATQAETLATKEAAETVKKRRRAATQTIFTQPLGVMEEANIGTRSLLGGG